MLSISCGGNFDMIHLEEHTSCSNGGGLVVVDLIYYHYFWELMTLGEDIERKTSVWLAGAIPDCCCGVCCW